MHTVAEYCIQVAILIDPQEAGDPAQKAADSPRQLDGNLLSSSSRLLESSTLFNSTLNTHLQPCL